MKRRIVFDFDNTMGTGRDTDDGLALLYLLGHGDEVEIEGLTCTYGNSDIDTVYNNTLRIADELDLRVPVLKGASRAGDAQSEASVFLAEEARCCPGELVVLATGSLTNLKGAFQQDPAFFDNLSAVYLMGGVTEPLLVNGRVMDELNFSCDSEAARLVLGANCPVVVATAQSCLPAVFTKRRFSQEMGADSWLMRECESWFDWMTDGYDMAAFVCWDVVAAASVVEPGLFDFKGFNVSLDERMLDAGRLEKASPETPWSEILIPGIKDADVFCDACFKAWKRAVR